MDTLGFYFHSSYPSYKELYSSPEVAYRENNIIKQTLDNINITWIYLENNNLICMCFLTIYTSIIHQNDFLQQYGGGRIKHTVDSSKQRGPGFIMKNYYDTGGRQGRAALKFLFNTSRRSQRSRTIMNFITLFQNYVITKIIIQPLSPQKQQQFFSMLILMLCKCKQIKTKFF